MTQYSNLKETYDELKSLNPIKDSSEQIKLDKTIKKIKERKIIIEEQIKENMNDEAFEFLCGCSADHVNYIARATLELNEIKKDFDF